MRILRGRILLPAVAIVLATGVAASAVAGVFNKVAPGVFDPGHTFLVQAKWLDGIGCPTNARLSNGTGYTDPACITGDPRDTHNAGLLLAKTGRTANNASGFARLTDVTGTTVTELGYDLRKPDSTADPRGSHCGAGAPRFNVTTTEGTFFVGCCTGTVTDVGNGWIRIRWNGSEAFPSPITGTVQSVSIVFDEGQDTGPDNFGLAVLDNVDYNGVLVGRG
jgi:hypothetical protein